MSATKEAPVKETITARMSRWAAGLTYPQLSQDAVYQAKRFLLDSVGCPGRISAARCEDRVAGAR